VKLKDALEKLPETQRECVMKCAEECDILDLEGDVEVGVDPRVLEFLKVLRNRVRLEILRLLKNRWLCVCLISTILGREQTLISHHLKHLKKMGLVEERKIGRMRFYRTNLESLRKHLGLIEEMFSS